MKVLLIKVTILLLFCPPALDLLIKAFVEEDLSSRFVSGGLLLFCLEQCRMAIVDLRDYFMAQKRFSGNNIFFYFVVLCSTIALELVGFYYMYFHVNIGAIIILISQLWFNSLAKVKIEIFREQVTMTKWGIKKRIGELLGAILGIILIILWSSNIYPLIMGFLMLTMMVAFITIKYGLPNFKHTS